MLKPVNLLWVISVLFWDITQRIVAIPYRRIGTTNRCHLFGSLTLEDGKDWLSRNVGKELPLLAADTSRWKPEVNHYFVLFARYKFSEDI